MTRDLNPQNAEKWVGPFYFNRKDTRVVVPKRLSGLGWTFNFANPLVYILLVLVAAVIAGSQYFF